MLTKTLEIIYQQSWLTREVPGIWRLVHVMPSTRNGRKEDPGNYTPGSLASVPSNVTEQILSRAVTWHIQDNQVTKPSQHRFMKGRNEGTALNVLYLDLQKQLTLFLTALSWRS